MSKAATLLNRIRKVDAGIAEWADMRLRSGDTPENIVAKLRAVFEAVEAERSTDAIHDMHMSTFGSQAS